MNGVSTKNDVGLKFTRPQPTSFGSIESLTGGPHRRVDVHAGVEMNADEHDEHAGGTRGG